MKKKRDSDCIVSQHGQNCIPPANSSRLQAMLDAAARRIQESGGISHEDVPGQVEEGEEKK